MDIFLKWCSSAGEWLFIGFGLGSIIDGIILALKLYFLQI